MHVKILSEIQQTHNAVFTHPRLVLNLALATHNLLVIILLVAQHLPIYAQLPPIVLSTHAMKPLDVSKQPKFAPNELSVKLPVARRVKVDACTFLVTAMTMIVAQSILVMILQVANTFQWFVMITTNAPKIPVLQERAVLMRSPYATMDSIAQWILAIS
jgi:hypothetical protein